MAISSLLIHLEPHTQNPSETLQSLTHWPNLTVGIPCHLTLPAVLDTPSPSQDSEAIASLLNLPGIAHIDVLTVFFDHPTHDVSPRRLP